MHRDTKKATTIKTWRERVRIANGEELHGENPRGARALEDLHSASPNSVSNITYIVGNVTCIPLYELVLRFFRGPGADLLFGLVAYDTPYLVPPCR